MSRIEKKIVQYMVDSHIYHEDTVHTRNMSHENSLNSEDQMETNRDHIEDETDNFFTRQPIIQANHRQESALLLPDQTTLEIEVQIGDGRSETIFVNSYTNADELAHTFCRKHSLGLHIAQLLATSIKEKVAEAIKNLSLNQLQYKSQALRSFYANCQPKEVLIHSLYHQQISKELTFDQNIFQGVQNQHISQRKENQHIFKKEYNQHNFQGECQGAEKVFFKFKQKKNKRVEQTSVQESNTDRTLEKYVDQNKGKQKQKEAQKLLDSVSEEICRRLGKENIIKHKQESTQIKKANILKYKESKQEEQYKQCVFRPNINQVSERVAMQLNNSTAYSGSRYEQLYNNHKETQQKKELSRRNSIAALTFKPTINHISSLIMSNKKTNQKKKKSDTSFCEKTNRPKTNKGPTHRNSQHLPIGDYLYNQAKQKEHKANHFESHSRLPQVLHRSQALVQSLKVKRINQVFITLTDTNVLQYETLDLSHPIFKHNPFKYFIPIFKEMLSINVSLTQSQFIEAALRMIEQLSPQEKHQMLKKICCQQKSIKQQLMNSKSREMLKDKEYDKVNIYTRGLIRKNHTNEKAQRNREEKVRQQLLNCTFKPRVRFYCQE